MFVAAGCDYKAGMDATDRLLWAMKHAGRTNKAQLAREAKVKDVTLRSYFLGHAHPPLEVCERIGERLGVNGRWLFDGTGDRLAVETQPFVPTPLLPQDSRITLPVYGMAIGGDDGRFELNGSVVDRVAAPPGLQSVTDAYAVMVVGDSMEPRYHAGETVYIHPRKPVQKGGYVVVQLWPEVDGDPVAGLVKRFISLSDEFLTLEQFNPPKVIRISRGRVKAIHRIVLGGE